MIEEELGYQLYKAIESIKFSLSTEAAGTFVFNHLPVEITADVTREAFENWICRDIDAIRTCIDQLLEQCHVTPGDIDSIFMTGGTSLVPRVRRLFEDKFSPNRLRRGGELTSVARGLALRALIE